MIKNTLSPDFLIDTTKKENVYLLGFLWADGWIRNVDYTHVVGISLVKDDFVTIEPLLRQFGVNSYHDRQRYREGGKFGRIGRGCLIQSKSSVDFLLQNDYDKKSGHAPTKILSKIPDKIQPYFWRGYLDGDGCISCKKSKREIAFWSVIDQDWSELVKLATCLNIRYQIYTYSRRGGKHKSSVFRMGRIDDLVKFGKYVYGKYDGIGLYRKYNHFLELLELQSKVHRKTSKQVGVFRANKTGRWGASFYDKTIKKQKHLGWFSTETMAIEAVTRYEESHVNS